MRLLSVLARHEVRDLKDNNCERSRSHFQSQLSPTFQLNAPFGKLQQSGFRPQLQLRALNSVISGVQTRGEETVDPSGSTLVMLDGKSGSPVSSRPRLLCEQFDQSERLRTFPDSVCGNILSNDCQLLLTSNPDRPLVPCGT